MKTINFTRTSNTSMTRGENLTNVNKQKRAVTPVESNMVFTKYKDPN